jgi:hypothetical protein
MEARDTMKDATERMIEQLLDSVTDKWWLEPYLAPLREVLEAYQQLQELGAQKPEDYVDRHYSAGDVTTSRLMWVSGQIIARVLHACTTRNAAEAMVACELLKTELREP